MVQKLIYIYNLKLIFKVINFLKKFFEKFLLTFLNNFRKINNFCSIIILINFRKTYLNKNLNFKDI